MNGISNITIIPKDVGDKHSMVSMEGLAIKKESGGDIECIALDDWVNKKIEKIDFIKMDAEGFERKVLIGGMNTIKIISLGWVFVFIIWLMIKE